MSAVVGRCLSTARSLARCLLVLLLALGGLLGSTSVSAADDGDPVVVVDGPLTITRWNTFWKVSATDDMYYGVKLENTSDSPVTVQMSHVLDLRRKGSISGAADGPLYERPSSTIMQVHCFSDSTVPCPAWASNERRTLSGSHHESFTEDELTLPPRTNLAVEVALGVTPSCEPAELAMVGTLSVARKEHDTVLPPIVGQNVITIDKIVELHTDVRLPQNSFEPGRPQRIELEVTGGCQSADDVQITMVAPRDGLDLTGFVTDCEAFGGAVCPEFFGHEETLNREVEVFGTASSLPAGGRLKISVDAATGLVPPSSGRYAIRSWASATGMINRDQGEGSVEYTFTNTRSAATLDLDVMGRDALPDQAIELSADFVCRFTPAHRAVVTLPVGQSQLSIPLEGFSPWAGDSCSVKIWPTESSRSFPWVQLPCKGVSYPSNHRGDRGRVIRPRSVTDCVDTGLYGKEFIVPAGGVTITVHPALRDSPIIPDVPSDGTDGPPPPDPTPDNTPPADDASTPAPGPSTPAPGPSTPTPAPPVSSTGPGDTATSPRILVDLEVDGLAKDGDKALKFFGTVACASGSSDSFSLRIDPGRASSDSVEVVSKGKVGDQCQLTLSTTDRPHGKARWRVASEPKATVVSRSDLVLEAVNVVHLMGGVQPEADPSVPARPVPSDPTASSPAVGTPAPGRPSASTPAASSPATVVPAGPTSGPARPAEPAPAQTLARTGGIAGALVGVGLLATVVGAVVVRRRR